MVTIKDVAAKAGVNPSTVSRVLKDNKSISQKTKDKVRQAMAELGYVPNVAAQMLASGYFYQNCFLYYHNFATWHRIDFGGHPFSRSLLAQFLIAISCDS